MLNLDGLLYGDAMLCCAMPVCLVLMLAVV